jgi:membrane-bound ClpP family serine protease
MSGSYLGGSTVIKPKYNKKRAKHLRERMKKHIEVLNKKNTSDREILENFVSESFLIKKEDKL